MLVRRLLPGALALGTVWVLAQPPVLAGGVVGANLPLEQWTAVGRFPTQQACERQRSLNSAAILGALNGATQDAGSRQAIQLARSLRCVERPLPPTPAP